jgi:hypothetical protein
MSDGCPMTLSSDWLGNKSFESWQWISERHGENPALDYTFPVHFLCITLILHLTNEPLVLDYSVHFDWRWKKLQLGRTPLHSGRTNKKSQFHFGREECPVVSSLRRTISRMCRTMSVSDRYFKACWSITLNILVPWLLVLVGLVDHRALRLHPHSRDPFKDRLCVHKNKIYSHGVNVYMQP